MKAIMFKTLIASAVLCTAAAGLSAGILEKETVHAAQHQREVQPFARWSFDGAEEGDAWLQNSGKSGKAYDLQKTSYAKRENWGENNGGVNFADNSCLYLRGDKYIFNELSEFTVSVKFYAMRNPYWYSSLFSWDTVLDDSAENMARLSIGYKTGQDWLRYSDVGILGSCAQEGTNYGAFFTKGESLLSQNADKDNSGWWTFIYSVKPGGVAITYLTTGTRNVNYVKAFKVPADYSLHSDNGVFSIGGSFRNKDGALEYKANAILDDVRIYDFAMTETQINELRWTDKVCASDVVISSEILHGSVSASKPKAMSGERVLLNVTPDSGYVTKKVLVNGEEILPLDGVYYAHMTKAGMSVYAEFSQIQEDKPNGGDNNQGGSNDNQGGGDNNQSGKDDKPQKKGCTSSVIGFGCAAVALVLAGAVVVAVGTVKYRRRGGKGNDNK